jgi:hypothetical protein
MRKSKQVKETVLAAQDPGYAFVFQTPLSKKDLSHTYILFPVL